jgi:hypothetical protein
MSEQNQRLRDALLCHREMMLERAEQAQSERVAKACHAVAEKDAAMIARLRAEPTQATSNA